MDSCALAQWSAKVICSTSRDPLGLANRVSQRLVNQLLFGITAIGRRARYYSYSLWAIHDVMTRENPSSNRELTEGIYWRDAAFAVACLLHHADQNLDLDGVVGKTECINYLRPGKNTIDLGEIQHIKSDEEGGFGLNYKGSLINLSFFTPRYLDNLSREVVYDVSNDKAIRAMLQRFHAIVKDTVFYREYACSRKSVPMKVLEEFGQHVCLCRLHSSSGTERDILRDILFERTNGINIQPSFRPDSLRLLLDCASLCSRQGLPFTERQFRCMTYYGQCLCNTDIAPSKAKSFRLNERFLDISNRWRVFFLHHYFSLALEGLLVIVLETLSEHSGKGLTIAQIIRMLKDGGIEKSLCQLMRLKTVRLETTTLGQLLNVVEQRLAYDGSDPWNLMSADSVMSEECLTGELRAAIRSSRPEAAARCLLVMFLLLERCFRLKSHERYWGWAMNASQEQKDISALMMYLHFSHKQDWRLLSLERFLEVLLARFVVEQHEMMVPEKTGDTSWLTWDNGHIYFENSFDGPSPGNSRFESARQILCDLGLMQLDDDIPSMYPPADTIISEIRVGQ